MVFRQIEQEVHVLNIFTDVTFSLPWWYWTVALVGFALNWRINYAINGGEGGFSELGEAFWEDFLRAIPGSKRRRGAYIRELVDLGGDGFIGDYSYQEIRERGCYEEVGKQVLPGPLSFWGHVFGWMFWPVPATLLALVVVLSWVAHFVLIFLFGKERTEAIYDKAAHFFSFERKNS